MSKNFGRLCAKLAWFVMIHYVVRVVSNQKYFAKAKGID